MSALRRSAVAIALLCLLLGTGTAGAAKQTSSSDSGRTVVQFNVKSRKYHSPSCPYAHLCTNCVPIALSDAIAHGGVACKRCRGVPEKADAPMK